MAVRRVAYAGDGVAVARLLANMQHSRFSSSEPVTAMNTSASSTPASDRVVMDEPLPRMLITS